MKPIALAIILGAAVATRADTPLPFISPVFGDHMVLQRDKYNTIWGWTKPRWSAWTPSTSTAAG